MKVGTLAKHRWWGKGLVIERLFHHYGEEQPPVVRVLWNKPKTTNRGWLLSPTKIYEEELTIISGEE